VKKKRRERNGTVSEMTGKDDSQDVFLEKTMEFESGKFIRHQGVFIALCFCGIATLPMLPYIVFRTGIADNGSSFDSLVLGSIVAGTVISFILGFCRLLGFVFMDRKQKQLFVKSKLQIMIFRSKQHPFFSYLDLQNSNCFKYYVNHILSIRVSVFSILIKGDILCEKYDNASSLGQSDVPKLINAKIRKMVYIPRNFSNEDQIIKIDIEKYNDEMRKLVKKESRRKNRR
jgi:hypothetical protein